jgi:hypothetical protein
VDTLAHSATAAETDIPKGLPADPYTLYEPDPELPTDPFPDWYLFMAEEEFPAAYADDRGLPEAFEQACGSHIVFH